MAKTYGAADRTAKSEGAMIRLITPSFVAYLLRSFITGLCIAIGIEIWGIL